jgi:cyclophilin family peptidyl-prolyl cis-trans isomerase
MQRSRTILVSLALANAIAFPAWSQSPPGSCDAAMKGKGPVRVKLTTSMGPIVIELDRQKAPISTDNFVKYVDSGQYNATVFHRVIDNFMIQGGGFTRQYVQKPTRGPIKNEAANGLKNDPYTIAMARTSDPDSATAQFFINSGTNTSLDYGGGNPGYAVFGKVVDGKDVVDKIRKVPVKPSSVSEAQPLEPVVIEKAECVPAK